jgi:hypothetical protein
MVRRIHWAFREKAEKWWWSKSKLCAITILTEVHWFMFAAVTMGLVRDHHHSSYRKYSVIPRVLTDMVGTDHQSREHVVKCDFRQPCQYCVNHHLYCFLARSSDSNMDPSQIRMTEIVPADTFLEMPNNSDYLEVSNQTLAAFDIDPFPCLVSFWNDPLLHRQGVSGCTL